jgi:acyl-CoA synthetase (AMP-forming)/AMP-acid ligase II/acyl carrier protein
MTKSAKQIRLPKSIFDIVESGKQQFSDRTAFESPQSGQLTYHEVYSLVTNLITQHIEAGIDHGDRVAIVMDNGTALAITMLATSSHCVAMPLNPEYKELELTEYLKDLNATKVISDSNTNTVAQVAERLGLDLLVYNLDQEVSKIHDNQRQATKQTEVSMRPNDVAVILQTSGSTSKPKKAPLTHFNLCRSVKDVCDNLQLSNNDVCLCMWQQFHIGGLVDLLLVPMATGGKIVFVETISVANFFEATQKYKPTWFQAVPTTLYEILQFQERNSIDVSNLKFRLIRAVAAQHPPELIKAVETLFDCPVLQTYGMTEASPLITSISLPPAKNKIGSVGTSVGPEIKIESPDGNSLNFGEIGEVVIRGDNVITAYEAEAEINDAAFKDGWFHTGDTGYLDEDGFLFLTGRIKEQINRGGEKIVPNEIDRVFLEHPAVYQAAAFPVSHPTLGEDIAVAIVLHNHWKVTEQELRDLAAEKLVGFKVPQKIVFVNQMPLNSIGKVDRNRLSQALEQATLNEYVAPKTPLEESLVHAWQRALRLEKVGILDNFFDLGGTSLSGVALLEELNCELNISIPAEVLYRVSNIKEMAKHIEDLENLKTQELSLGVTAEKSKSNYGLTPFPHNSSLRNQFLAPILTSSINRRHSESLIFCANTQGGKPPLIWCFNAPQREIPVFAECLGSDQPLYGLYSGGGAIPISTESIEYAAGTFVNEVAELSSGQDFFIGGNCRGAMVSYQIANALKANNMAASGLILLEHFITPIFDYDDPLYLMFGEQSKLKVHQKFNWGEKGWQQRFINTPKVDLVPGSHGHFFLQPNVSKLSELVTDFMQQNSRDKR